MKYDALNTVLHKQNMVLVVLTFNNEQRLTCIFFLGVLIIPVELTPITKVNAVEELEAFSIYIIRTDLFLARR